MSRSSRVSLGVLTATVVCAGLWSVAAVWIAPRFIEAGWRGESLGFVNGAFSGRATHPLDEYLAEWHRLWPGLLLNILGLGLLTGLAARPETWALARRAFGATQTDVFRATPKLLLGVVVLSLSVGECYPFSQFAMYSAFEPEGGFLYITDGADQPIPTRALAGLQLDRVKRIFETNLMVERERRFGGVATNMRDRMGGSPTGVVRPGWWYLSGPVPKDEVVEVAAATTLRYVRDEYLGTEGSLRLWRTRLVLSDKAIQREPELLGEVSGQ